jgi:hypothetical protein
MCPEWRDSYASFRTWAHENGYSDEYTLDRINNEIGYEPSNCRWVPNCIQARNKRNNVWLEYNGKKMVVNDWAKETGIRRETILRRIRLGWNVEEILTIKPVVGSNQGLRRN